MKARTVFLLEMPYEPSESGYLQIGQRFVRVLSVETLSAESSSLCVRTLWPWEESYLRTASNVRDVFREVRSIHAGVRRLIEFFS